MFSFHFTRKEDIARADTKKFTVWNFTISGWIFEPRSYRKVTTRKGTFKVPRAYQGFLLANHRLPVGDYAKVKIHCYYPGDMDDEIIYQGSLKVKKGMIRII